MGQLYLVILNFNFQVTISNWHSMGEVSTEYLEALSYKGTTLFLLVCHYIFPVTATFLCVDNSISFVVLRNILK